MRAPLPAAVVAGAVVLVASCALPRPPRDDDPAAPTAAASSPASSRASAPGTSTAGDVAGFAAVERAAVRVRNVQCASGVATGSGFAVDDHTLITNQHVVAGARTLQVDTYDGQELSVRATGVSTVADLAVVRTREALPAHVPLAAADPAAGAAVSVIGFPLGGQMTTSPGHVLGPVDDPLHAMAQQVLALDAEVAPGSSGSAVLDGAGEVVGVVYAGATDTSTSFAVPVSVLSGLLGGNSPETVPSCG